MRVTKYGHSCLLLEEGETRLLIDPGVFSEGFEGLTGLTAILHTHQHGDHLDVDRLGPLVKGNPQARLICDEGTEQPLREAGLSVQVVHDGDELDVAGLSVQVHGQKHEQIHPDIPNIPNVGYLIGGRFFHPGDAFTEPGVAVDVLALPAVAPWCSAADSVDYLRAVKPKLALPVHDGLLAPAAEGVYDGLHSGLAPQGTEYRRLGNGASLEI
jgi:L-ascorbate metabolism protein UlaG (beta-lactamase superfamily)